MPLLDLPPEIREMIYKLALPRGKTYKSDAKFDLRDEYPGLLTVSKEVRAEAAPLFFKHNSVLILSGMTVPWSQTLPTEIRSRAGAAESSYKFMKDLRVYVRPYTAQPGGLRDSHASEVDGQRIKMFVEISGGLLRARAFQPARDDIVYTHDCDALVSRQCVEVYHAIGEVLGTATRGIVVEECVWSACFS